MNIISPTKYKRGRKRGAIKREAVEENNLRVLPYRLDLFVRRSIAATDEYVETRPLGFYWSVIGSSFLSLSIGYSLLGFIQ